MEDLEKMDLSQDALSQEKKKGKKILKVFLGILVFLIVLGAVSVFTIVLPAQRVYSLGMNTYQQARKAWDAIKKQDVEGASVEIKKTRESLSETQKSLESLSFLRYVPIANGYYSDADHFLKGGMHGLAGATIVVDSVKPYADVLGLKGQGSFVMGSAEQRIETAVMTMGKITPQIDEVSNSLVLAKREIDAVDPNHYPSFAGGDAIKENLKKLRGMTDEGVTFVDNARPLIKLLPSLLGDSEEKKYLILFQNDKELRPTGGFITAYAVFRVDKGIIHVDSSGDIYRLDDTIRKSKAPEPILKYFPKVTTFNLRDSNLSPDFIESMKTFESMYNTASGKTNVDGIIALDTSLLVSTIKILDDEVIAGGIKFTSKIDKRCDCPQVIYVLEDMISRPVNYVKTGRKDILGVILYAIMEKALKSSPKVYWGPLFQDMLTKVDEKHILVYLHDKDAQMGIEAINAAGRLRAFEGDYFHINDANFGGAKANLYVKQSVVQDIDIASDGSVAKTVTVNYKNPYPPSDCDLERGGLCLNAVLRNWFRVYVPKGSTLVDSTGSEVKATTYEEMGKTVFEGFLTVKPQGAAILTIKYKLPFKVAQGSALPFLIQKQPGTYNNEYAIKVNGKQKEKFELLTDKELKLKI